MLHSRCQSIEATLRSQIEDLKDEKQGLVDQIAGFITNERALNEKLFAVSNPIAMRSLQAHAQAAEQAKYATGSASPMPTVVRRNGLATFHDPRQGNPAGRERVRPSLTPEAERFRPVAVPPPEEPTEL